MFEFGKRIFGRKGVSDAPSPQDLTHVSPVSDLTVDGMMARAEAIARNAKFSAGYYFNEVIEGLPVEDRTDLFAAILTEVDAMAGYHDTRNDTRGSLLTRGLAACMKGEMTPRKEHLPGLIEALLTLDRFRATYYVEENRKMLSLMRAAIKDGGFFTSSDIERLGGFAGELRVKADKEYRKPYKKTLIARAEAIEKLAGIEVSATSVLLERCEGADNPHAPGEKPANYEFWAALLAAVVYGLDEIEKAVRGPNKRGEGKPGWLTDPAAFAETWPAVGPIAPRFDEWTCCQYEGERGFAELKKIAKERTSRATPEAFLDLPAQRGRMLHWYRYNWRTAQIPALDVLADLENAEWTAFAEHLVSARIAPRPTKAWVKDGLALAERIGLDAVERRLQAWLGIFHAPRATPQMIALATNCYEMDNTVAHLNEKLPDWPVLIAPEQIGPAGRALAMQMASGAAERWLAPISVRLLFCDDRQFYKSSKWFVQGALRISVPRKDTAYDRNSYNGWVAGWLKMSVENEQILRGALWMVAEMPDRAAAIDALERIALSAAASLEGGGENQMRSKVIANAAIATLIDMGGPDVNPALLRLSREIDNRTVTAPLFKALNG